MHDLSTAAQQVLDALTEIGHGTVADIREKTGKSARVTDKAIRDLADAALITETDPGDGSPTRWAITAPAAEPTDPPTATDAEAEADTDGAPDDAVNRGAGEPADDPGQLDQPDQPLDLTSDIADETAADQTPADTTDPADNDDAASGPATDETGKVPARPKPPADRKVLAVAGVLGDYPDGATLDEIVEACGFNVSVVARLLQAMEQGDAARRIPADAEADTPQRWQPGPGKASEVDPNPAPPRCPTCRQVIRTSTPKTATATPRSGSGGTVNSDGNEPLSRGVLRGWVEEFINTHPGHELTPGTIAEALGAQHSRTISPGAVLNNCRTLAMNQQIRAVRSEPFTVTANPPAAASTTDSEQQQ